DAGAHQSEAAAAGGGRRPRPPGGAGRPGAAPVGDAGFALRRLRRPPLRVGVEQGPGAGPEVAAHFPAVNFSSSTVRSRPAPGSLKCCLTMPTSLAYQVSMLAFWPPIFNS